MSNKQGLAKFAAFVESTLELWQVPGAAIAIVREGEIIFLQGFGKRNIAEDMPTTPHTRFALASGTKAFTTMALGMLVDEGKLDWDKPVREYLPSFTLFEPFAGERMTPRDLVTHRSGLPRHDLAWYHSAHSRAELIRRLRFLEPNKDLRSFWQYQNLMYMVAGYLVEHITGQTWEAFVQERIFSPLGMANSNCDVAVSQTSDDFAVPYKKKREQVEATPFYQEWAVGPAGSVNTSAADMAKWLQLHVRNGKFNDRQLVSEAQVRDMHSPHMVVSRPARYAELPHQSYGLGWFVEPYRGYDFVHHGGNIDGFSTMTTLMPREGIGVVVLCNMEASPLPWVVCLNAYERLLGLSETSWNDRFKQDEAELKAGGARGKQHSNDERIGNTWPSHPLESYVGEYEHPGYGILSFTLNDGALQATMNNVSLPAEHYHYDTFELVWEAQDTRVKATFRADARGDVVAVSAPLEPTVRDIVFTRVPNSAMREPSFLAQFVGEYEVMGMPITVSLRANTALLARVPGLPEVELVPRRGTEFTFKDLSGFGMTFMQDEAGRVTEAQVVQPGAVFVAKRR